MLISIHRCPWLGCAPPVKLAVKVLVPFITCVVKELVPPAGTRYTPACVIGRDDDELDDDDELEDGRSRKRLDEDELLDELDDELDDEILEDELEDELLDELEDELDEELDELDDDELLDELDEETEGEGS